MFILICYCETIHFLIDIHEIYVIIHVIGILVSQSFFLNVSRVSYFLQDIIITDKRVLFLPAISRYYQTLVCDISREPFKETAISSQKLKIKLNKKYEKQIKSEKGTIFRVNIEFSILTL